MTPPPTPIDPKSRTAGDAHAGRPGLWRLAFGSLAFALALLTLGVAVAPRPARAVISVPPGYFAVTYASGLPRLTSLTFGPDSALYATQYDGKIFVLRDRDHNGAADTTITYTTGLTWPLGLTLNGGYVYVNSLGQVYRCRDTNGDYKSDEKILLITNLPTGRHWNTGVLFGPDGNLYVGLGSMKNLGVQPNPLCASIHRYTPQGVFIDQFAKGFRNPYGMAFHPSGALFCTDNGPGPDSLGFCQEPPDELNWVQEHRHYGFPDCIGASGQCADVSAHCPVNPCTATQCEFDGGCVDSMQAPVRELDPHSSSDGLCFGTGFTGFDSDDVFIAQYGQSEVVAGCPTNFGHRVVRVRLHNSNGQWTADPAVDFATGIDHPLAVAVGPDHALYVSDFTTGNIIRIAAVGGSSGVDDSPPPAPGTPLVFSVTPNPAVHAARVTLAQPGMRARAEVFNLAGRRVATAAEASEWTWDLRDLAGRRVAAGVYLVRVTSAGVSATRKLLVVD